ncbi:hypothetical protein [Alteraurantiacibacter aquimixticola]|uniref:GDT1 family protein n=1 Tax=Alteraurantiacibacter aquimixticola TaxID=2489173 RepID=A0A4T3EYH9_9SPHN|nr:hypothetical protein [Alteraurantiacibacter aquimixticola]TIX49719.1 hypothetical protein E5222_12970 [Alteraurantiacibacter aquimixticola]
MPAFFLSFITCLLVTLAGRDMLRMARLSGALGGGGAGLHVAVWIASAATSALAAWLGLLLAPVMPPAGKQMFVAIAMFVAALELVILRAGPRPSEPTFSLGAILLVLLAAQATDAARFLLMALSLQTGNAVLAAVGGTLGSGAALSIAVIAGDRLEAGLPHRRAMTLAMAALLALAAVLIDLSARQII